ncbi:MAG: hypothetical protein R3Y43_08045 [Alphaproteobacteria bacterium]
MSNIAYIGLGGLGCNLLSKLVELNPNAVPIAINSEAKYLVNKGVDLIRTTDNVEEDFLEMIIKFSKVFIIFGFGGKTGFNMSLELLKYFAEKKFYNYTCLVALPLNINSIDFKMFAAKSYSEFVSKTKNLYLYDLNRIALSSPKDVTLKDFEKYIAKDMNDDIVLILKEYLI